MDTLKLLDELHDLAVDSPKRLPLVPIYWGLDTEEIKMMIAKVRANLPQEVKVAATTARDSDRIIADAQSEAEAIRRRSEEAAQARLKEAELAAEKRLREATEEAEHIIRQAELKRDQLVSESDVIKIARSTALEIENSAQRVARETRRGADEYAYSVLNRLEDMLNKHVSQVTAGKRALDESLERERVKA